MQSLITQSQNLIKQQKLPHAILLIDHTLSSYQTYIDACSAAILNTNNPSNHIDYFSLQPDGKQWEIKVEAVRELIEFIYKSPKIANHKVVVIHEVDRMNKHAANAILKSLEEPPADTTIFLIAQQPASVLPTIASRCTTIYIPASNCTQEVDPKITSFNEHIQSNLYFFFQETIKEKQILILHQILAYIDTQIKSLSNFTKKDQLYVFQIMVDTLYSLLEKNLLHNWQKLDTMMQHISKIKKYIAFNLPFLASVEYILLMYILSDSSPNARTSSAPTTDKNL